MLDELIAAIDEQTPEEGLNRTYLDDIMLFRVSEHMERIPLIYDQCMCMAPQGYKKCHLTDSTFTYSATDYMVVPTVVPVEIEIIPEGDNPLLSLTMLLDYQIVQEVMDSIMKHDTTYLDSLTPATGLYLEPLTEDFIEPTLRLLKALKSKRDAEILGRSAIRELYYRMLTGRNGHLLASAARGESGFAQISKVLRTIHDNYAMPLDVPQLAEAANMSTRSFHNHFKEVTSHTPVQYLKRIRLEKARQFMVLQGEQAASAAHKVGYESPSQFSREFKRHFGFPPSQAVENSMYMAV